MKSKNKLIIRQETLPYLNLFDLNKSWLSLKQERTGLVEEAHELRARMWVLSHKITEIEEKISQAIVKLEKKNV
uniref:Uncharacterized protein n=1 Tax=viral metagenome TaxID=1070528 RepID=A0A6H1ZY94_9ZZZZ